MDKLLYFVTACLILLIPGKVILNKIIQTFKVNVKLGQDRGYVTPPNPSDILSSLALQTFGTAAAVLPLHYYHFYKKITPKCPYYQLYETLGRNVFSPLHFHFLFKTIQYTSYRDTVTLLKFQSFMLKLQKMYLRSYYFAQVVQETCATATVTVQGITQSMKTVVTWDTAVVRMTTRSAVWTIQR